MLDVELELVDAPANRFRIWGLTESLTLWGEPALAIAWGRKGSPLRRRLELFSDETARARRVRELLARRRRHGYSVVGAE